MDNCKTISITVKEPTIVQPDGSVTTRIDTKEIITNVSEVSLTPIATEGCINSVLTGLGEGNVPDSRLFAYNPDRVKLSETHNVDGAKVLLDVPSTVDEARILLARKVSDAFLNIDSVTKVWLAVRLFVDTVNRTELLSKAVFKVNSDLTSTLDVRRVLLRKPFYENVYLNDTNKINLKLSSLKLDNVLSTDSFNRVVNFSRLLIDFVDATDDFFGQANLDDDQYALMRKVTNDSVVNRERFALKFTRSPLQNTADAYDQYLLKVNKVFVDSFQTSDTDPFFVTNKGINELLALKEDRRLIFVKSPLLDTVDYNDYTYITVSPAINLEVVSLYESIIISRIKGAEEFLSLIEETFNYVSSVQLDYSSLIDAVDVNVGRGVVDSILKSDSQFFNINLVLEDVDYYLQNYFESDYFGKAAHLIDNGIEYAISKGLIDIVNPTDDFYGVANLDDDQYASSIKVVQTSLGSFDVLSRVASYKRTYTDVFNKSDTVSTNPNKIIKDIFLKSDSKVITVGKNPVDVLDPRELIKFKSSSVLIELLSPYETFNRTARYIRSFQDSFLKSDTITLDSRKTLSEQVGKTEMLTKQLDKSNNETIATSQFININKQDYFAENYIGPDYFGQNYSF